MNWIELGVAFISGGGLLKLLDYFSKKKQEKRDDLILILDTWKEDNARLRVIDKETSEQLAATLEKHRVELNQLEERYNLRMKELETKILGYEKEVALLRTQINLYNIDTQSFPYPKWVKDTHGIIISINQAYIDTFLKPLGLEAKDYIGKKDSDVWPEKIWKAFKEHDEIALSGKVVVVFENVTDNVGTKPWRIVKYPTIHNGVIIGTEGFAIPEPINQK